MDYNLIKAYQAVLSNSSANTEKFSLKALYEAKVAKSQPSNKQTTQNTNSNPIANQQPKAPKTPKVVADVDPDQYNKIIAKVLLKDENKYNQIPLPNKAYPLGQTVAIADPEDIRRFNALFAVTPPKKGQSLDAVGTKGSGNGEVALYWLLQKSHQGKVKDGRGGAEADLKVDGVGVEVKAYDTKKIGLGRFGDQKDNRILLSIVFGLKTLVAGLTPGGDSRVPSLDTFNKYELIESFNALFELSSNQALRKLAPSFPPINSIYNQIDHVLTKLNYKNFTKLKPSEELSKKASSELLLMFLNAKLKDKPGFGGYLATVWSSGDKAGVSYTQIVQLNSDLLTPDEVLDNVNANGAALIINPDKLFKRSVETK